MEALSQQHLGSDVEMGRACQVSYTVLWRCLLGGRALST